MKSQRGPSRAPKRARDFALVILLLASCGTRNSAPVPNAPETSRSSGPHLVFPDGYPVHVEIAADEETRQQGLMYRDRLAEDRGMIFFFSHSGEYPFWMKNTIIPLDMIWINDQSQVVHVEHDVPPCKADPCPSYAPHAEARYVLEVSAGVAAKHAIGVGSLLRFEGLEKVVVR